MASKHDKRSNSALDPMMAGFAAGAAAFIIYAMPQARFDEAVALSGLPMLLSAAQPPLGMTARFAAMAAAGFGSFLLVWLVLRALSKPAPKPKHRSGPVQIEMAPPRLRRADAHPDAPSRRPILAGVDLGRPFDEMPVSEMDPFEQIAVEDDHLVDPVLADQHQPWDSGREDENKDPPERAAQSDQYVDPVLADDHQPWDRGRATPERAAQSDQYVDPVLADEHQPWDRGRATHERAAQSDQYVDPYEPAFALHAAVEPSLQEEPKQSGGWLAPQEPGLDEPSVDDGEIAEDEFVTGYARIPAEEEQELGEDDLVTGFERFPAEDEQELAENDLVADFDRVADEEEQDLAEDDLVALFEPVQAEDELEPAREDPVGSFPIEEDLVAEKASEEVPLELSPREVQTVQALSERLAEDDDRAGSIPDLMERLEAGLRRRPPSNWNASGAGAHPPSGIGPAAGEASPELDTRLRGAIQELQKLAARGN